MTERFSNSSGEQDIAYLESVREGYLSVMDKVEETRARLGITSPVEIVAATKTVPAEVINYAASLGLTRMGENRVQELLSKEPFLNPELEKHFIGELQKNKVKYLTGRVALIHSVGSASLAREIGKRSSAAGYSQNILVEVNIGREPSKGGVMPEALDGLLAEISGIEGIKTLGIMTIAPHCEKKDDYRKYFEETYQILLDIRAKKMHNIDSSVLSMGMSDNYDLAIEYGATIIRPGSAIFGKRS